MLNTKLVYNRLRNFSIPLSHICYLKAQFQMTYILQWLEMLCDVKWMTATPWPYAGIYDIIPVYIFNIWNTVCCIQYPAIHFYNYWHCNAIPHATVRSKWNTIMRETNKKNHSVACNIGNWASLYWTVRRFTAIEDEMHFLNNCKINMTERNMLFNKMFKRTKNSHIWTMSRNLPWRFATRNS